MVLFGISFLLQRGIGRGGELEKEDGSGPLVYGAESPDNPGGKVRNLPLPNDVTLSSEFRSDPLNGVHVVRGRAIALAHDSEGKVTRREQVFTAIPQTTPGTQQGATFPEYSVPSSRSVKSCRARGIVPENLRILRRSCEQRDYYAWASRGPGEMEWKVE